MFLLRTRHHQPTLQLNFISAATIFILRLLHNTDGVPKTELGQGMHQGMEGPLIGGSRGPYPLAHTSTESKWINSILSEGTERPLLNIYRFSKIIRLNHYLSPSVQYGLSVQAPSIPNKAIGLVI